MNDLLQHSDGEGTADADAQLRDTVLVAGGLACVVFGTGLLMTHPGLRKLVAIGLTRIIPDLEKPLEQGIAGFLPEVERYMQMHSM